MGKGGGGTSTSTVTKADPWVGVQAPLQELYARSIDQFRTGGPAYYPNQTYAGDNWQISDALNNGWNNVQSNVGQLNEATGRLQQTAAGINPNDNPAYAGLQALGAGGNQNSANSYLDKTARGDYLSPDSNPYLKGMFNDAASGVTDQFKNAIAPGLASQFAAAGRGGSGAAMGAFDNASGTLGRTLNNLSSNIYGGAYESERGRQQQAMGQLSTNYNASQGQQLSALQAIQQQFGQNKALQQNAQLAIPGMQNAQQGNYSQLLGIGEYRRGQQQTAIDADKSRFDYGQNAPVANLQLYNQLLNGGMSLAGSSSQGTSSGPARNPFQGAAGGAAMGTSIMPGWGTAIGAVLGGLFG